MSTFTHIHVIISLVGIATGLIVLLGLLTNRRMEGWTIAFLVTTAVTSFTGFCFFPYLGFTPGQAFGIISTVLLALSVYGRYSKGLDGPWRVVYVVTAIAALYLNVFVAIVQSFQKFPGLQPMKMAQTSPKFAVAQGITLILFVIAGYFATRTFRPASAAQV